VINRCDSYQYNSWDSLRWWVDERSYPKELLILIQMIHHRQTDGRYISWMIPSHVQSVVQSKLFKQIRIITDLYTTNLRCRRLVSDAPMSVLCPHHIACFIFGGGKCFQRRFHYQYRRSVVSAITSTFLLAVLTFRSFRCRCITSLRFTSHIIHSYTQCRRISATHDDRERWITIMCERTA
jgi:hypothetical protein